MSTRSSSPVSEYAAGYVEGRHAADERVSPTENPHRPGSQKFHGWNDGHYDVRSARCRGNRFHDEAHASAR